MANEATVRASIYIKKDNLQYSNPATTFRADVSTAKAPVPGRVQATETGTNVSLAALTQPGLFRAQNLSEDYFVLLGVYDGVSFFPFLELLPGEIVVGRLWRAFGDEFVGTGSAGADANQLQVRGMGGTAEVFLEVFEK